MLIKFGNEILKKDCSLYGIYVQGLEHGDFQLIKKPGNWMRDKRGRTRAIQAFCGKEGRKNKKLLMLLASRLGIKGKWKRLHWVGNLGQEPVFIFRPPSPMISAEEGKESVHRVIQQLEDLDFTVDLR